MSANKKKLMCAAIAVAVLSVAAASAAYMCRPAVVDQGGGVASSSAYQVRASVGGPALGTSSSANYRVEVGSIDVVESEVTEEKQLKTGVLGGGCGSPAVLLAILALALGRKARAGLTA